jgi:hypothetical protein
MTDEDRLRIRRPPCGDQAGGVVPLYPSDRRCARCGVYLYRRIHELVSASVHRAYCDNYCASEAQSARAQEAKEHAAARPTHLIADRNTGGVRPTHKEITAT